MSAPDGRTNARAVNGRPVNNSAPDLTEIFADNEVVVACGSGGVGKTTVSAALAMAMVERHDKRVLVLTVDPARRLASALGLRSMGTDPVPISNARLRKAGISPRGELVAAMLDQKSSWDRLVERYAPSRESAARILANPFYKGISDAFVGSHEYIAMETLYELHAANEYDLLVIDTPPSRNALDFLDAPTRMSDFVGGRLLSWLARPSRMGWRALNIAATPFLRMADRLLGSDVLEDLSAFVNEVQGLYGGIQERSRQVYRLLRSSRTGFAVVTTLEPQPFTEAEYFCGRLREYSMPLRAVIVNRVMPRSLLDAGAAAAATALAEADPAALAALDDPGAPPSARVDADTARRLGEAFLLLHRMAERDQRQVRRLGALGRQPVTRLPLAEGEVVDIEGLAQLVRHLQGEVPAAGRR